MNLLTNGKINKATTVSLHRFINEATGAEKVYQHGILIYCVSYS